MSEMISILFAVLGLIIGWLAASQKAKSQVIRAEERLAAIEESKDTIKAQMENVATQVSRQNSEDFLKLAEERLGKVSVEAEKDHAARKKEVEDLVGPIKDSLHKLQESTDRIEKEREGAYQGLKRTVEGLRQQATDLRDTNVKLSTALRGSSKARGKWGEISLKNVAESAGMTQHCDFDLEYTLASGAGGGRVDMVAKIPEGGNIPIDAKVPLAAYWDALDIEDPSLRSKKMQEHAQQVKDHIKTLVERDYAKILGGSDFTVMYIPASPILAAAFEVDPTLQEYAFSKNILICTPVDLVGLLRTVGIYWQQHSMASNAIEIHKTAQEFYDRTAKFSEDLTKMGRGLNSAVNAYNAAVGSYDGRVMPEGRRLKQLGIKDSPKRKLETPSTVDGLARIPKNVSTQDAEE
mgnify:FL=1